MQVNTSDPAGDSGVSQASFSSSQYEGEEPFAELRDCNRNN